MRQTKRFECKRDALFTHYVDLERLEALENLRDALVSAIPAIEGNPAIGVAHSPRYVSLARPNLLWLQVHTYWIGHRRWRGEHWLLMIYHERAIPDRYFTG